MRGIGGRWCRDRGWREQEEEEEIPGKAPLTAKHTVKMVISVLSAMGSITVPTTVCRFHRRAM